MPMFEFECKNCNKVYDALTKFDETEKYEGVICPHCESDQKTKLVSCCRFNFSNPVGTDRWNNSSTGHDYRFKYNIPNVQKERERAEQLSHMGANPYGDTSESDFQLDTGIHDPEERPGLS